MMDKIQNWFNQYPLLWEARFIISSIVIVVFMVLLAKLFHILLRGYFEKHAEKNNPDRTNYLFLTNGINFVFFLLGLILIFYSIPALRALGLTLFASAGIIAAVLGLASQQAFSNIISGIFIVIFKPFRIGDMIKVGNFNWGMVEDITLRHTVIKSFQNERYMMPNSVISAETILNASIGELESCVFLEMGISYDSDVDLAMKIMREEAEKHPKCIDRRNQDQLNQGEHKVVVRLIGFGDSSVNLRAYPWAADPIEGFIMKTELFQSIKARFDAEGIEIPFPHVTVYSGDKTVP